MIYAFNGTGKTRLSREFKELIVPSNTQEDKGLESKKNFYYNAFTEDLFYWDNDLQSNNSPKLKIHENTFTEWVFIEQGQERKVISNFQNYTNSNLTPNFDSSFTEVVFSLERGNEENINYIKISKGEESNFVWSVFYSLLVQVINIRNIPDPTDRETDKLDGIEYIFIDDPVSSLDDNHLIQMAIDLSQVINGSDFNVNKLKFIITTHNPIFYNILYNGLKIKYGFMLSKREDGSFTLDDKFGDSNKSFSYHNYLISILSNAIDTDKIEKYHFTLLRNLYEKTANFLGYKKWSELLPDNKDTYASRIMNFYSHSTLLTEEVKEPTEPEKQIVKYLFNHLINNAKFNNGGSHE